MPNKMSAQMFVDLLSLEFARRAKRGANAQEELMLATITDGLVQLGALAPSRDHNLEHSLDSVVTADTRQRVEAEAVEREAREAEERGRQARDREEMRQKARAAAEAAASTPAISNPFAQ